MLKFKKYYYKSKFYNYILNLFDTIKVKQNMQAKGPKTFPQQKKNQVKLTSENFSKFI